LACFALKIWGQQRKIDNFAATHSVCANLLAVFSPQADTLDVCSFQAYNFASSSDEN